MRLLPCQSPEHENPREAREGLENRTVSQKGLPFSGLFRYVLGEGAEPLNPGLASDMEGSGHAGPFRR